MQDNINILIADDHLLFAKLLKHELESVPEYNVINIIDNSAQVIQNLEEEKVDVLLLDIHLNQSNGITILEEIRGIYPKLKIIMQTFETGGSIIKKAIEMGANGFITKFSDSDDIKKSIHSVINGETYLCKLSYNNLMAAMNQGIINDLKQENKNNKLQNNKSNKFELNNNESTYIDTDHSTNVELSDRELEILRLITHDKSSKAIADELSISYRTVETHRRNIFKKLGVRNSLTLMKRVIELEINFE